MKKNIFILFVVALSILSMQGWSQSKKSTLAVVDFVVAGMDSTYKSVMMEQTRIAFISTGKYIVMEPSELKKTENNPTDSVKTKEQLYDKSGNFNIKAIAELQKVAEIGVIGSIAKFGEMYSIAIKGFSSKDNQTTFAKSALAKNISEIPLILQKLVSDEEKEINKRKISKIDFNGPLYVYPTDNAQSVLWSPQDKYTTTTEATSVMNGDRNTKYIVESYGDGEYAAKICADLKAYGYDDWYLPSKEELNAMYNYQNEIENFPTSNNGYWYSTEDINTINKYKLDERACRCVRRDKNSQ